MNWKEKNIIVRCPKGRFCCTLCYPCPLLSTIHKNPLHLQPVLCDLCQVLVPFEKFLAGLPQTSGLPKRNNRRCTSQTVQSYFSYLSFIHTFVPQFPVYILKETPYRLEEFCYLGHDITRKYLKYIKWKEWIKAYREWEDIEQNKDKSLQVLI